MNRTAPFETHVSEYEAWFERYPHVFQSEVQAIRDFLPPGDSRGIEVGIGTGRFAQALGIKEGIEPVKAMREVAMNKKLEVIDATANELPYKDLSLDFVLMNFCISYLDDLQRAFREAHRVLKHGGILIVGFVEKSSPLGKFYEENRELSIFHRHANFYEHKTVVDYLEQAGFTNLETTQTLFHPLDQITDTEVAKPGTGEGSYLIIGAHKK